MRCVKSLLNRSTAPGRQKNCAVVHAWHDGITRMKDQRIAFDVIGAGQGWDISRSGVHVENGAPTLCWRRRKCFPARHLERAAIELDGYRLRACGHSPQEDDRKARKPEFQQSATIQGNAIVCRLVDPADPFGWPVIISAFEPSSCVRCCTSLRSVIVS
jgi:hypothetical protein